MPTQYPSLVAGVHQKRLSRLLNGHREIVHPVYAGNTSSISGEDTASITGEEFPLGAESFRGVGAEFGPVTREDNSEHYGEIIRTFGSVRKLRLYCPVQNQGWSRVCPGYVQDSSKYPGTRINCW